MHALPSSTLPRRLALCGAIVLVAAISAILIRHLIHHRAHRLTLSDGTTIYYRGDSSFTPAPGFPHPRAIRLDGDFYIETPAVTNPLELRSRLLVVTVTGAAKLRLSAFSHQPGEEVDVLAGHAQAMKAYDSPYREPDILETGEMSMVNQDIDLMEKEHCDRSALRRWADALVAAAGGPAKR